MSFHFPYNFYPVTGEITNSEGTNKPRYRFDYENTKDSDGNPTTALLARHDVWQEDKYSGFFEVVFTTKSPTLVGNEHLPKKRNKDDPSIVTPYYWNGQLALPANSLRGMIATIAETLSQSTLRILDEKYYPAFAEINPDLIPWKNKRTKLTPAELLFGVVDEEGTASGDAQNLASRVRFSDAILQGDNKKAIASKQITLNELSSPKPDGVLPNFGRRKADLNAYNHYFKLSTNKPARHQDVLTGSMKNLKPLGRKFYLNRTQLAEYQYINTGTDQRCMKGKLINIDSTFKCKISFENLSNAELSLLKASIQPSTSFMHHLGLGKSLGLGAIQVTALETQFIDRKARYACNTLKTSKAQQDTAPKNDDSLIDLETLKIILMANNEEKLPRANLVHWRNNRNGDQNTRPIPVLNSNMTSLPFAKKVQSNQPQQVQAPPIKPEAKESQTGDDKDLAENNTDSAIWLKKTIGQLCNNKPYKNLSHDNIVTILKGKALSKKYIELPENNKKEALALVHQQFEERKIKRNELSAIVEKRYFPK